MYSPGTRIALVYGRRWRLFLLWYLEVCIAGAALWALTQHGGPPAFLTALGYLVLCGAALTLPAHVLGLLLRTLQAKPAHRRHALQLLLAFTAAATSAMLSTDRGWAAIVCILLVGNALWALELELRAEAVQNAE